ncbi:TTF-type domain-containing protein [Citrus sinensis]|uniref:TTF-type domain-containing protein n=1 Tax=Citrus sinensis TaxID=2711 RepID=A0ACB8IN92_CITSI|nr:TTF-type domain-containing protein [Citrus sinensis]
MCGNSKEKVSLNLHDLPRDPGLRTAISKLDSNIQDEGHDFPTRLLGEKSRRFVRSWFDNYPDWLEYSIVKDATFCLYCYVFREENGSQGVGPCFIGEWFRNWKKKEMLRQHIGGVNSAHNIARRRCESLMNQKAHGVPTLFNCCLAFRGNNESQSSNSRGNFLELLQFLADHNEKIKGVIFNNAPTNLQMTSPDIQKQIVSVCSAEISRAIIKEIGDSLFSVMIDESRDISTKDQMAAVLRYVDKRGHVVERFMVLNMLLIPKLSLSKHHSTQYYLLHSLFCPSIIVGPCFCGKKHQEVNDLFSLVAKVINIVAALSKRFDILKEKHIVAVIEALKTGELQSEQGMNQEITLKRSGDTRWSSHYGTLISIITMFSSTINVLEIIANDASNSEQRFKANSALKFMQTFDFLFTLYLMKNILGFANEFRMREHGWNSLLSQVSSFCEKHFISVPVMENIRFNEVNTELLLCLAYLCPKDSFAAFNKEKLLRLTQLYPKDFSQVDLMALNTQLDVYIMDMQSSKIVETNKHNVFSLVYLLVTLALLLPVATATATVERVFSAMNYVKNRLRSRMGDEWLNDNLVVYIEKDVFDCIDNEIILQHFQHMKSHRGILD